MDYFESVSTQTNILAARNHRNLSLEAASSFYSTPTVLHVGRRVPGR
jgi:hypothetical protein